MPKFFKRLKEAWRTLKGSRTDNAAMNRLLDFLGIDRELDGGALSEVTYFTCMKVLSESIGKLPLKLLCHDGKNGVVPMREHPLYYIVHDRPNPYMTASTFWGVMEFLRNHFGNSYALIEGCGSSTKLWILDPTRVEVWWDDACLLKDVPDVWYKYSGEDGQMYFFGSEEILHLKSANTLDGLVGKPARETLAETITGNRKAQKMLNRLYDSGFVAKAAIQYTGDISDKNEQAFLRNMQKYANGEFENEGIQNMIPLPFGTSLQILNMKLADSQFIEIKQYSALQIASAFGIKPNQIGDYTRSSYASAEAQQLSFYVDTLLYIIKQYEEELSYKLLTDRERKQGLHFKFNVAVILRADLRTQIETLASAVTNGVYTPNEAREMLDRPAKDGGDKLLVNGNAMPVTMAGSQYLKGSESDGK